jgi:signal-transduction protein with cAMP-binding, CBS, and nucleotidyltransferase domain
MEISLILKALPSTLKTHMAKFMYQNAIFVHKFLQDRDDEFYSHYLEELKVERYNQGEIIVTVDTSVDFVYFLMSGIVKNATTSRYFMAGHMINHDCVFSNTPVKYDYIAESKVMLLKYKATVFSQILNQFPDFHEDIKESLV